MKYDVCIMGLGYIGLPTASLLASRGKRVLGVDVRPSVLKKLKDGSILMEEPGLQTLLRGALTVRKLKVSQRPAPADYFLICVPTPLTRHKKADLSYVFRAVRAIRPYVREGNTVIVESTIPPGTTHKQVRQILERPKFKVGKNFYLAYCPERVLPGKIIKELILNERLVGGIDAKSAANAAKLYSCFTEGTIHITDATTAEIVKLAENSYRDVNIAFANELSNICEQEKVNVWKAIELANRHPRVNILKPGPGVGGHCIAVDPWFLIQNSPQNSKLLKMARQVNDTMPKNVCKNLIRLLPKNQSHIITCFGMTYKANVSDIRESPALEVIKILQRKGFTVRVWDPKAPTTDGIRPFRKITDAIKGASAAIILVDHKELKEMTQSELNRYLSFIPVLDMRGILKKE